MLTVELDETIQDAFSATCYEMGLTPDEAMRIFASAVVREHRIPFDITTMSEYEKAMREYEHRINHELWIAYNQIKEGNYLTTEELLSRRAGAKTIKVVEELERRRKLPEEGKSKTLSEEESWAFLKAAGCHV